VTNDLAVETRSLVVRRGKSEVLHGIDLHIPQGQLIGLLGPSGSGKTTLMRAILGTQQTASGTIAVLGHPAGSRVLRRQIGYMAQTASIYDDLTVQQNLDYFAAVLKAPRDDVARVLEAVDLTSTAKQLAANLSGGQRTRVSLAIALLGTPKLLILDEPTVGLDPVLRRDLWQLFQRLTDTGATLIVSSHVMDEARRCNRLVLLRDGSAIADDTPEGILTATGTTDHDDAFLKLIERGHTSADGRGAA
jgi:ABC-2 type transport system ATP-binding protein